MSISSDTIVEPMFGMSVIEHDQRLILLAENPDRPSTWHAMNTATAGVELCTPSAAPRGLQTVDGSEVGRSLFSALASLQQRLAASEVLTTQLAQIRDYAVAAHERGDICLQGLQEFLEHFDLQPYPHTIEVQVSMYGTASINAADLDTAIRRVRYVLDGFAHSGASDSDDFTIELGSIEIDEIDQ